MNRCSLRCSQGNKHTINNYQAFQNSVYYMSMRSLPCGDLQIRITCIYSTTYCLMKEITSSHHFHFPVSNNSVYSCLWIKVNLYIYSELGFINNLYHYHCINILHHIPSALKILMGIFQILWEGGGGGSREEGEDQNYKLFRHIAAFLFYTSIINSPYKLNVQKKIKKKTSKWM